jgi:hypothetical protein
VPANFVLDELPLSPAKSRVMTLIRNLLTVPVLAGMLLTVPGCADSTGETIEPGDLIGTWWVIISGVTLTFESDSLGQVYELRDPQGAYSHILEAGNDLLVQGYWSVAGTALYLADETGPAFCNDVADRFVISMNNAKNIMTLDHLGGDECLLRASILADAWQRRDDAS